MRQTIRLMTITAAFVMSTLPHPILSHSYAFSAPRGRSGSDIAVAASKRLPAPFHMRIVATTEINPNATGTAPETLSRPSREIATRANVAQYPASETVLSSAPAALLSLPRQPTMTIDRISFGSPTLAPMAFVRLCMQYPQDCTVRRTAFRPKALALTTARRAQLEMVNREVNRAIRPQKNLNGVLMEEWLVAPRAGDCNDYAVTKRHKLLALGWPSRALLLAEVVLPSGEHHLLLIVRTREKDLALDNLNRDVHPVSQLRYQWIRAQQTKNPKFWSKISVTHSTRVAMDGG